MTSSNSELDKAPAPGREDGRQASEGGLLRASGVTGIMTLFSRILGLFRDVVIARLFGTSIGADAFFLANKIPNFMRRLFAEGAFSQAFVPILSEYRSNRDQADVRQLISAVMASLGGFLSLLTALVLIAAPVVAIPIAFGFTDEPAKFALFVQMLRITFPYLLLISMTALCGAILNSYGRFAIPAFTPALLNVSLITAAYLLSPHLQVPELALAWGVLFAGVIQLLFQLPFLMRLGLLPMPRIQSDHEGLARIKTLMVPALFGVSVSQINLLFDTVIASMLVTGSVSWLYFSDRLMELPLGIFGVAIAIVVLPSLSRKHAEQSMGEFAATLDWALRLVCLIAVPATLALVILAEPLLVTLFENDNFTTQDVVSASGSLRAYALGLLAFMSIKIFAPGFYARQDTRTPVRIGVIAMAANMAMNIGFYLSGFAHVGLALATSIAACLNAGMLWRGLARDGIFRLQSGWPLFLLQMLVANAVMVVFLLWLAGDWQLWLSWSLWERVAQMTLLVVGGMALYGVTLVLCGLRWRQIYR